MSQNVFKSETQLVSSSLESPLWTFSYRTALRTVRSTRFNAIPKQGIVGVPTRVTANPYPGLPSRPGVARKSIVEVGV